MSSDLSRQCLRLQEEQAFRKTHIKMVNRTRNAAAALARRAAGWSPDAPDAAKRKEQARRIVAHAFAGKPQAEGDADVVALIDEDLGAFSSAAAPFEQRRAELEKEMILRARTLPVANWASGVAGLGWKGLAVIVGETGDLGNYPHWRMVWKRLGLMPVDGRACSRLKASDLTAEQWTNVGYNGRRLAEIFACVTEPMAKHQIAAADKTGTEFGEPRGLYGEIYVARRERTKVEHPDWPKAHTRMDALRLMTKALVSDLWSEWRKQHMPRLDSNELVAASAPISLSGVSR